jgi:gliding motility-associated-like protein
MRKLLLFVIAVMSGWPALCQNPSTVFTIPNRNILLPCGVTCTSFNVQVPHIKKTTSYIVTTPPYKPYAYTTPGGTELLNTYADDVWSNRINLPFAFSFCFFGTNYTSLLMGSNSVISFDPNLYEGDFNEWEILGPLPNFQQEAAAIFGPLHDIDPRSIFNPAPTTRKIEWRVEGNAPYRRFIGSYNSVAVFNFDMDALKATHQMVLYENTGIIEVYIKDKPIYPDWNDGLATLGLQNYNRSQAVTAPGKNGTQWGSMGMDSCFRFVPSGGATLFKRAELLVNGVVVSTNAADTSTTSPGSLNLNFPNVCPTADSTAYEIRVYFGSCSNPAFDVPFSDTVFVKKSTFSATATKTDASCTTGGSITVTNVGGIAPYTYSIDNGANYQGGNVFSNLPAGSYTIVAQDAGNCPVTVPITIALIGAVNVNAGPDTTICMGASLPRTITSNATNYSWSPATGVSNPTVTSAILSPQVTTTYTVTASIGNCTAQDTVVITVAPGATASAGADAIILQGQTYQLQASASPGSQVWTPNTGLSASNILNPVAHSTQTITYTLNVTTAQGCIASDDMTLTVVPYCIRPMDAFTPNGDGVNEYWLVTNGSGCLDKARAQVFNRYGAKVFESNDYRNDWNGTYKGKPLPDGTYYFIITFRLITGKEENLKGSLTILR